MTYLIGDQIITLLSDHVDHGADFACRVKCSLYSVVTILDWLLSLEIEAWHLGS